MIYKNAKKYNILGTLINNFRFEKKDRISIYPIGKWPFKYLL